MLRFLSLNYEDGTIGLFDCKGEGLAFFRLLEDGVEGVARGVKPFSYELGQAGRSLRVGNAVVTVSDANAQIRAPECSSEILLGRGLLELRCGASTYMMGLKNLRLTAAGEAESMGLDGSAIFPYSAPLEGQLGAIHEVVLAGPIVLAPKYWSKRMLHLLSARRLPLLVTSVWMALADHAGILEKPTLLAGPEPQGLPILVSLPVIAADCAMILGVLHALEALNRFLQGRPPTPAE
jgi:hypothetical protein